jgi:putative transport protein
MIDWLFTTLRSYPEIAIFLTLALGYYFGKFTFKGIGLGAVRSYRQLGQRGVCDGSIF